MTFQVVRETMQARCLPLIESLVAFRVVAHQNLAESRVESFDMRREFFAILKLELFLPALFGRTRRRETLCRGITQKYQRQTVRQRGFPFSLWEPRRRPQP